MCVLNPPNLRKVKHALTLPRNISQDLLDITYEELGYPDIWKSPKDREIYEVLETLIETSRADLFPVDSLVRSETINLLP